MAAPHDNKGIEEILDNEGTTTGAIILGALMTTATHPLTCVRVLMQQTTSRRLKAGGDSIVDCFQGKVYSSMVGTFLNSTILQVHSYSTVSKQKTPLMKISVQENKTCVQAAGKVTALVISHPLYETIYSGLRASFKEIYENEGIAGFFSGIIPRILGEVLSLVFFRGACFLVSRYAVDSEVSRRKEVQIYTNGLFQYVAGVVTYPFVLVTHMMIVNHVG
ncbi:Mitochondrial carrier-like protein 2 [Acropora cervicornis]|uniref:Mitochondrial carrier-like protein 2 n=1 Tax=Acropora cervicornis TaxID=6130 RepID=A0AAD9QLT8_ACRCE|nr:Mitochondrial carrier-like protein 2 [Acropora cervicornis]